MDISYFILIAAFFAGTGFLMRKYDQLKESLHGHGFYFLHSRRFWHLYSIVTADTGQPLYLTAMIAILLCLIPTFIESLVSLNKTMGTPKRKNILSASENYGRSQ